MVGTKNTKENGLGSKLRVRVESHEHKILDQSVKQILNTGTSMDSKVIGPIPLPTKVKKYTVNRSPFVFKDSREQFEMRIHARIIDIINPTPKLIEALGSLDIPSSVSVKVKIT